MKAHVQEVWKEHHIDPNLLCDLSLFEEIQLRQQLANDLSDEDLTQADFSPDLLNLVYYDRAKELLTTLDPSKPISLVVDYDVDGCMSGVVGALMLRELGYKVQVYSNNKFVEGYGIKPQTVDRIIHDGGTFIITADNGIAAYEAIEYAKEKGLTVIVTDHHEPVPGRELVPADAILNYKLEQNKGLSFRETCGCGTLYLFLRSLYNDPTQTDKYLDLVAIATIADFVPLIRDNRFIVQKGLALMNTPKRRESIDNLLRLLNKETEKVTEETIGFQIGPVINAVTRMTGDITPAIQGFLEEDSTTCRQHLAYCVNQNQLRKELCKQILESQSFEIGEDEGLGIFVLDPSLDSLSHHLSGVVGLVAGKIKDLYQKPVIVLAEQGERLVGSARSVEGFDLFNYLHDTIGQDCLELGGHKMAAGLTIEKEKFDLIKEKLLNNKEIEKYSFTKTFEYLMQIKPSQVNLDLAQAILSMRPFGAGYTKPLFRLCGKPQKVFFLGKQKEHIKFIFNEFDILGWHMADEVRETDILETNCLDALGTIGINTFRDVTRPTITLESIQEYKV